MAKEGLKLQLALQGGGARIVHLLAALEAVQKLQDEGVVKVTRMAGTSAGSVAACLFAAGLNMADVRQRLKTSTKIVELTKRYTTPKKAELLNLSRNRPIWPDDPFVDLLKEFFPPDLTIDKLNIPVSIIATDLRQRKKRVVVHSSNTPVINALLDSCGLPFLFRIWGNDQSGVVVDGGICENLPIDELVEHKSDNEALVAMSFQDDFQSSPTTLTGFAMAILEAAIGNSVMRARAHPDVDHVFSIATKLSTFDFPRAMTEGLEAPYDVTRLEALQFFRELSDRHLNALKSIASDPWTVARSNSSVREILESHWRMYANGPFYNTKTVSPLVKLQFLSYGPRDHPDRRSRPDSVRMEEVFTPSETLHCYWFSLDFGPDYTSWNRTWSSVYDLEDGSEIRAEGFPTLHPDGKRKGVLLFFERPLTVGKSYKFLMNDYGTSLLETFFSSGEDEIVYALANPSKVVEQVEIVLSYPNTYSIDWKTTQDGVSMELLPAHDWSQYRQAQEDPDMAILARRFRSAVTSKPASVFGGAIQLVKPGA